MVLSRSWISPWLPTSPSLVCNQELSGSTVQVLAWVWQLLFSSSSTIDPAGAGGSAQKVNFQLPGTATQGIVDVTVSEDPAGIAGTSPGLHTAGGEIA